MQSIEKVVCAVKEFGNSAKKVICITNILSDWLLTVVIYKFEPSRKVRTHNPFEHILF